MNDEFDSPAEDRANAEEALAAIRQASRVDFALRIANSLRGAAVARPLAIAFEDTVSRMEPPESHPGEAQGDAP
jgi:hypothetical protein